MTEFPKKKVFGNFNEKDIENRKKLLEQYLNELSRTVNLLLWDEACKFLEVDEYTKSLLSNDLQDEAEKKKRSQSGSISDKKGRGSEDPIICPKRKEEGQVMEFLSKLNNEESSIARIVQEFETYYFTSFPQFSREEIKLLLWGDAKYKGLIHFCGDTKRFIGSKSCIQLFSKLIKFEYNSVEAEKYVSIFCITAPSIIKEMHLDFYIKEITSHDSIGLVALYYYLNNNPFGIGEPIDILTDPKSIEEYEKWVQNKVTCGMYLINHSIGYLFKSSVRKSSSKGSMGDRKTSSEDPEDEKISVVDIMAKSLNEQDITPEIRKNSVLASADNVKFLESQLDAYSSWDFMTEYSVDSMKAYSKGPKNFRITTILSSFDPLKASSFFFNLEKRASWDNMHWKVLHKESETQEVAQIFYRMPNCKTKFTESVLYRTMDKSEDGSIIITERSIGLPPTMAPGVKRLFINACIYKFTLKIDTDSEDFVECQAIWTLEEGYNSLVEFYKITKGTMLSSLATLNKLLQI